MIRSRFSNRQHCLTLLLGVMHFTGTLAQEKSIPFATSTSSSSPPLTTLRTSTSTSSSAPQTHTIQVGLLDHKMRPETTEAPAGDIIEFDFYPLNHSVVRAEYGFPCIPYEMTGSGKNGFFSGFNPVDRVLDNPPKYSVRINDTEPIFFYCSAPGSCITWGMVGGINLNSSMSIDRQRTLAKDSAYMLQPGEPFPAESPVPSTNPVSSDSSPSTFNSTLAPSTAPNSSDGLSTGTIVGIVIAAVSALLFGALIFFCWGRTKSLREAIERKDATVRRISTSPEQVSQHACITSHAGFQSAAHTAGTAGSHPGSPDPGAFGHQHNPSMASGEYFPTTTAYMAKYTSPIATHPAYHPRPFASPPHGGLGLDGFTSVHQNAQYLSPRSAPAPGYYETFSPGQDRVQERAVEMEAVTAVGQADDSSDVHRASKH
ncbi:extracellular serine-rich protein [Stagonosporopsis vannaccii]|nr:extracellular serine-rich protein [Stagonosporopsis vannaccii]